MPDLVDGLRCSCGSKTGLLQAVVTILPDGTWVDRPGKPAATVRLKCASCGEIIEGWEVRKDES